MPPLIEDTIQTPGSRTPIQNFYKGSKIFITGGTGFLGGLLIEKLLRSCPDISKIYMLIREKKGKNTESRLNELFNDEVFAKMRESCPNYRDKVKIIAGDIGQVRLGISEADRLLLVEEVTLVFHAAATVRFDEKLKLATFINVRGTRDLLALCEEMKRLQFVTHVSTAYSNCTRVDIDEIFYPPQYDPHRLITLAESVSEDTLESISEKLRGDFPNTYAFTKSVSEDLIRESKLPIAVYRPSIIVSTYKEPLPGWINNFYGPQGVSTGAMMGLLRSLNCDEDVNSNIVPVDMCVNCVIAIPWESRNNFDAVLEHNKQSVTPKQYKPKIYHFESSTDQPLNWKRFRYLTHLHGQIFLSVKMIGIYFFHLRKNPVSHKIAVFFLHVLPALLCDSILTCLGKKPMLAKAYEKIHKFSAVISYFCLRNWAFTSQNVRGLREKMSSEDSKLFFCDLTKLDWDVFFKSYLKGCRVYLLQDPIETLAAANNRYYYVVKPMTYVFLSLLMLLVGSLLWYTTKFLLTTLM